MGLSERFDALLAAALAKAASGRGGLGKDIAELSRLFGAERSDRKADYMRDPRLRAAYLAFFLPQYAAKIALLLGRMQAEGLVPALERPRVLDVGAGPLTGLAGAWLWAGALGPSTALDLAGAAMSAGREILSQAAGAAVPPPALVEAPVSRRPLPDGPFDLVVVAHVLNEIGDPRRGIDQRTALLRALADRLAPGGRILVVEPGTRVHGRALMAVRDALVDAGAPVLSPCRGAPSCPLLRRAGDWCHGDLPWTRPPAYTALEAAAGIQKDVLKQSHLLLGTRDDATPAARTSIASGLRLVGGLMRDPSGVERRYGCGKDGLVVLRGKPLPTLARDPPRGALLVDERGIATEAEVPPSRARPAPRGRSTKPRGRAPRR